MEGQERARTQTSSSQCWAVAPVSLSTSAPPLDPQSKEDFPPQPLRPVDVAPSSGKLRDDG